MRWRRGPRVRRSWSLRTQLVVSAVALIAVVCAVIGTVTTIAVNSSLESRLDDELRTSGQRSFGPPGAPEPRPDDLRFVVIPGQPIGTVGARTDGDGELTGAARSTDSGRGPGTDLSDRLTGLTTAQAEVLAGVPPDGRPHTVSLPGLGDYRAQFGTLPGDDGRSPRRPADERCPVHTQDPRRGEVCVSVAGLVAAGIAGDGDGPDRAAAPAPGRRHRDAGLPTAPAQRRGGASTAGAERETDPRTEVGQVGAALNRMLGHVGAALDARQESETRVRQFVADASHELRTPLASIRGYAELTRRVSRIPEHVKKDTGSPSGPDRGAAWHPDACMPWAGSSPRRRG